MIIRENLFTTEQLNTIKNLSRELGLSLTTTEILYSRGFTNVDTINDFLNPSKEKFYSPYLLSGMDDAVKRIINAKDNGETVVVYGDYDADGICATTILYKTLVSFGINTYAVVPERENGYGLTESVINQVLDTYFPDLIITVDCGISACEQVEYLKDLGVDVIITDHHEIPEKLPNTTIINCRLKNQKYPYDSLCGAGVAYKLCCALIGSDADKYLDLVALATVADSMPLTNENRNIVYEGLQIIKNGKSDKPLKCLIEASNLREITSSSLAYYIAPKINAAGRMDDAYSALKLLLSNDYKEIDFLIHKLFEYNTLRQQECEKVYKEAKAMMDKSSQDKSVIVLYGKDWKSGILGIVSARICDEFNLPTIIFSKSGDALHGSARSIEGINIFEVITLFKDLLIDFGGHAQAAGITIKEENLAEFESKLNAYIQNRYDDSVFESKVKIDGFLKERLTVKLARELAKIEPCGIANKKPLFASTIKDCKAQLIKCAHVSFSNEYADFMYFNASFYYDVIKSNLVKTILFETNLSSYNGKETVKGFVKSIASYDGDEEELYTLSYRRNLALIKNCENLGNVKYLTFNEIKAELENVNPRGQGTLIVVNNPKNLCHYNLKGFEKCVYSLTVKGGKNAVLVGGVENSAKLCCYNKIIYLDTPLCAYSPSQSTAIVCNDLKSFTVDSVCVDRAELGKVFNLISLEIKKGADSLSKIYHSASAMVNVYQFYFAVEVFKELEFIIEREGLYVNTSVKKELSTSKIYNEICKLLK